MEGEGYVLEESVKFFGGNRKKFEEDVEAVREWTRSQPHFPEIPSPQIVRNFLILNKCSVEKAKQKLDNYYTVRTQLVDLYGHINPHLPHMREFADIVYMVPHPKRTITMYRVLFMKIRDTNFAEKVEPINAMRQIINIMEIRLLEDVMFGDILIFDCQHLPVSYFMRATPTVVHNFLVRVLQDVFSFRIKALHLVHMHPIGEIVITIMKKAMKPKLFQRVHVSSNFDFFLDYFPRNELPQDFGGEGPALEDLQEDIKRNFLQYQNRFDKLDNLRVDESLRPGKLTNDDLLGYHGNFKKLDVD